jgi:hypothetical protein
MEGDHLPEVCVSWATLAVLAVAVPVAFMAIVHRRRACPAGHRIVPLAPKTTTSPARLLD